MAAKAANDSNWHSYIDGGPVTLFPARAGLNRVIESPRPFARSQIEAALLTYRDTYRRLIQQLTNDSKRAVDVGESIETVAAIESAEAFFDADSLVQAAEFVLQDQTPPPARCRAASGP